MSRHDSGWIRSYRQTVISLSKDPNAFLVFSFLCHFANHSPTNIPWGESEITLKQGDILTSAVEISNFWNLPRTTVNNALFRLQRDGFIDAKRDELNHLGTVFSIKNHEIFTRFERSGYEYAQNRSEEENKNLCKPASDEFVLKNKNDNSLTDSVRNQKISQNFSKWSHNEEVLNNEILIIKGFLTEAKSVTSFELEQKDNNSLKRKNKDKFKLSSEQLELIYKVYPPRENTRKKYGLNLLQRQITELEAYLELLTAIKNYRAYCVEAKIRGTRFVQQFGTFANNWKEFVENQDIERDSGQASGQANFKSEKPRVFDVETLEFVEVKE